MIALRTALERLAARFAPKPPAPELRGELCISVSGTGWRATLRPGDGAAPETLQESLGTEQAALAPPDMLRRAVRAITPSQRERIGSVRLLVADPAISIVDNRSARIKSTDPAGIRQAGAQELGSPGAVYASLPFGQSSEHEVKRGVYAFATTDRARDYLGALDSLAIKLVQLLPAALLLLDGAEERPFAAIDVRATSSTLLLADPETGAVACREIAVGWRSFVAALAEATSVSVRDAAEGLERRACFRPDAGAANALATGTERALGPILALLRTELQSTLDFFAFQRMAGAPERLWVSGEAHRVRGLTEWIGQATGLQPTAGQDTHERFLATDAAGSANLIEGLPKGLLRIGKVDYHFTAGRFRPDQPEAPVRAARPPRDLLQQKLTVALLRETLASFDLKRVAVPALAVIGLGLVPWVTIDSAAAGRHRAADVLAAAMAEDAALRSAVVRRARPPEAGDAAARLYWTEKLAALAEAVPDAVWITKAAVTPGVQPAGDRLVLEGDVAAAPAGQADPLGRVTELIDRLSGDAAFMRDVSAISFDGVTVARGPEGDVAHFTITVVLAGQPRSAPRRG